MAVPNFITPGDSPPPEFPLIQVELYELDSLVEMLHAFHVTNDGRTHVTQSKTAFELVPVVAKKVEQVYAIWESIVWPEFDATIFRRESSATFECHIDYMLACCALMRNGSTALQIDARGAWSLARMLSNELNEKFGRVVSDCTSIH